MKRPVPMTMQNSVKGFTLIELMVVVAIVAILAAIALPSYRRYVVANSERETQAKMLQLQVQLEQWRARSLTYRGFQPQKVSSASAITYGYDETDNTTIYVPDGSTSTNYRYMITLVNGVNAAAITASPGVPASPASTKSLVPSSGSTTVDSATGRTWRMLATPNTTGASYIMLSSTGTQCKNKSAIAVIDTACGTGQEDW